MSQFWILLELRMMEVVVTTGTIGCAKLQSDHHQQTNMELYRPDALPVPIVKALKGKSDEYTNY